MDAFIENVCKSEGKVKTVEGRVSTEIVLSDEWESAKREMECPIKELEEAEGMIAARLDMVKRNPEAFLKDPDLLASL